jgi:multiple sugar transport system substrate-binding protein
MANRSSRIIQAAWHVLLCVALILGCSRQPAGREDGVTLVFKHGKIAGDAEPLSRLLDEFEKKNPGIHIKDETLPAATDEQHQFYVINLEGESSSFDVLAIDVIWVPEFTRAGWLRNLSHLLPPSEREAFFRGPMASVTQRGSIYAIPWYIDAGILYYRKDLLERHGLPVPVSWEELARTASIITGAEPGLYGFIWQGKQYEGLICDVLEYLWSNGGGVLENGRVIIDSGSNREALTFMRDLIYEYRVTPDFVTTVTEEPTRHIFGAGKAVFMRNWPYAWNIFNTEDSPMKGRVGVAPLPAFAGHESASTLGGWQLGINKYSKHPEEAEKFILFMTAYETQKILALTIGYKPTRHALYKDDEMIRQQPFIAKLHGVFEKARPRPVTPFYMMISQVMQPEFSAVLTGIKDPGEALKSAQRQVEFILKAEEQ